MKNKIDRRRWATAALAAAAVLSAAGVSRAALTFTVDTSGWPAGWYDAAVANMQTVVNEYNAYGDFTTNNNGNIYVYYNAGIPTAQSGYGASGGSIGVGGTYPNVRVLLHESSHWLGTGTLSDWWTGPYATAMIQEFEGMGTVLAGDTQHYWPYGENYDNESSPINDARHIAMVYALREDFGNGSLARPSAATSVTMTASDAVGTSGFNYSTGWSDAHFPQAGTTYSTANFVLRTPASTASWNFAGDSLTVNNTNGINGGLLYKGSGTMGVVTFKNLILDGGYVRHASTDADLFQLAGKITVSQTPTFDAAQGNISVSAPISGGGSIIKTGGYMMTLTGVSSYSGTTTINAGTLRLAPAAPIASYSFANVSGTTVVNEGTGGAALNGTLNANGGSGIITTTGGPAAGMGALVLNGTGTTVDINSGVTDLGGSGTWTVSTWIKTTQAGATILNKGDGSTWNSGFATFYLGDGSNAGSGGLPDAVRWGGGWVTSGTTVNNGAWHMVTYTNAGGTKAMYVDGVLTSLSQNQFSNPDTGSQIRIGFAPSGESDGEVAPNASLSGVKIYSSALSATQVSQLYSGGPTGSVLPTTTNVSIATGAVLDTNSVNQTIGSLTGPKGAAVKLGGGQLTVASNSSSTFAGNLSGAGGSLAKSGAGTLTLSGANTYTGATTITGGTLQLSSPGATAAATPIASYSFSHLSGNTVINDGSGGAAMNGTLNANGGSGVINASGGPAAGMGALVLNGTGTTVDINSGVTDLGSSSTWSVSAWVKTTQAGATILNKGNGSGWSSGYSTFYLGDGSNDGSGGLPDAVRWGGGWMAGATAVNDGTWHLLTYTDAAGLKSIYVDGVMENMSQSQFLNTDTGTKIRIGFAPTNVDGELPTSGSLSGINIYSAALSPAQVAALYTGATNSAGPLPAGTNVTIASGATLDLNGVTQTIGSLSGPVGSAVTLGSGQLIVNSAANSVFAGAISGNGSVTKSGTGTLTLSGSNVYAGATTINAGTLAISASGAFPAGGNVINNGTLSIAANATVGRITGSGQLNVTAPAGTVLLQLVSNGSVSTLGGVSIGTNAALDLANDDLIIHNTTPDTVRPLLQSGYAGGTWNGSGIRSTTAAANPGDGLGIVSGSIYQMLYGTSALFAGATVAAGDVLIKYTYQGDADLSGTITLSDYALIDSGFLFQIPSPSWINGDFNYDGVVDYQDYALIDYAFSHQSGPLAADMIADHAAEFGVPYVEALASFEATVPEPASLALLGVALVPLCSRRRTFPTS